MKVSPYTPIKEHTCIKISKFENVWAIKFHGNPVNK